MESAINIKETKMQFSKEFIQSDVNPLPLGMGSVKRKRIDGSYKRDPQVTLDETREEIKYEPD